MWSTDQWEAELSQWWSLSTPIITPNTYSAATHTSTAPLEPYFWEINLNRIIFTNLIISHSRQDSDGDGQAAESADISSVTLTLSSIRKKCSLDKILDVCYSFYSIQFLSLKCILFLWCLRRFVLNPFMFYRCFMYRVNNLMWRLLQAAFMDGGGQLALIMIWTILFELDCTQWTLVTRLIIFQSLIYCANKSSSDWRINFKHFGLGAKLVLIGYCTRIVIWSPVISCPNRDILTKSPTICRPLAESPGGN